MHHFTIMTILVLGALLAGGCGDGGNGYGTDDTTPPAESPEGTPETVNAMCPIMGNPVDPEVTTEFEGDTVGFCCPECIPKWQELSDEEKRKKLE